MTKEVSRSIVILNECIIFISGSFSSFCIFFSFSRTRVFEGNVDEGKGLRVAVNVFGSFERVLDLVCMG